MRPRDARQPGYRPRDDREDREERYDRRGRYDRYDRYDRRDRYDNYDRPERYDRGDRYNHYDRYDRERRDRDGYAERRDGGYNRGYDNRGRDYEDRRGGQYNSRPAPRPATRPAAQAAQASQATPHPARSAPQPVTVQFPAQPQAPARQHPWYPVTIKLDRFPEGTAYSDLSDFFQTSPDMANVNAALQRSRVSKGSGPDGERVSIFCSVEDAAVLMDTFEAVEMNGKKLQVTRTESSRP